MTSTSGARSHVLASMHSGRRSQCAAGHHFEADRKGNGDRDLVGPGVGHSPLGVVLLGRPPVDSRRDRRATTRVTAFVSTEILDDEPRRLVGMRAPSKNRASLSAASPCPLIRGAAYRSPEPPAHGRQTPGQPPSLKAVKPARRSRAARTLTGSAGPATACLSPS
jgi:hypothetical protein